MEKLPKDPMMLLSVINLKLRDYYQSLDALCEEMEIDKEELTKTLGQADYEYDPARNQFV